MDNYFSAGLLVLFGIIYIVFGVMAFRQKMVCEQKLRLYAVIIGVVYVITGIVNAIANTNKSFAGNLINAILSLIIFGLNIWGLYLLLDNEAINCRNSGNKLWSKLLILYVALTSFSALIYPLSNSYE